MTTTGSTLALRFTRPATSSADGAVGYVLVEEVLEARMKLKQCWSFSSLDRSALGWRRLAPAQDSEAQVPRITEGKG